MFIEGTALGKEFSMKEVIRLTAKQYNTLKVAHYADCSAEVMFFNDTFVGELNDSDTAAVMKIAYELMGIAKNCMSEEDWGKYERAVEATELLAPSWEMIENTLEFIVE